jgi:uncharacterized protein
MKKDFEWDPAKAASNLRKHGISFETAALAFTDVHAVTEFEDHYGSEDRWHTTGMVNGELLLLVVHTGWDDGEREIIRIISARRADKNERRNYEKNLRQIFN